MGSRLSRVSYRLASVCFDKNGEMNKTKVAKILESLQQLSYSKRLVSYKSFLKALKYEMNKRTAVVESSIELNKKEQEAVIAGLKKRWQIVSSEFNQNSEVLGGLRVRIGDYLMDSTLKRKLHSLKEG